LVPKSGHPLFFCSERQVVAKKWKACRSAQSELVGGVWTAEMKDAGPPAEMKKADGPCRAIEIVVVMRLTTNSARPESNFQNLHRSRWISGIDDQKPVIVRNLNQLLAARHVTERASCVGAVMRKGRREYLPAAPAGLKIHWISNTVSAPVFFSLAAVHACCEV